MRRVEVFAWCCDQELDGGHRSMSNLIEYGGDFRWLLICKDASSVRPN